MTLAMTRVKATAAAPVAKLVIPENKVSQLQNFESLKMRFLVLKFTSVNFTECNPREIC